MSPPGLNIRDKRDIIPPIIVRMVKNTKQIQEYSKLITDFIIYPLDYK